MGATILIGVSIDATVLIFHIADIHRILKSAICKIRSCNSDKNCYIGMNFNTAYIYIWIVYCNGIYYIKQHLTLKYTVYSCK